jgi:hypothetical protein
MGRWHTPAFHGVSLTNHLDFSPHMLWLRWGSRNPPKRWGRTCHQKTGVSEQNKVTLMGLLGSYLDHTAMKMDTVAVYHTRKCDKILSFMRTYPYNSSRTPMSFHYTGWLRTGLPSWILITPNILVSIILEQIIDLPSFINIYQLYQL